MSEVGKELPQSPIDPQGQDPGPTQRDGVGRAVLLVAGGLLLSVMVSCACGPVR